MCRRIERWNQVGFRAKADAGAAPAASALSRMTHQRHQPAYFAMLRIANSYECFRAFCEPARMAGRSKFIAVPFE
jgi:hypothetical protein